MIELCKKLYKINRSLTGDGNYTTLEIIRDIIPIEIKKVKSGTKVFDWEIPPEWNIRDAYVRNLDTGQKVIDLKNHNLHVVSYSIPVSTICTYEKLLNHLHYLEDQPKAIPYVTSYYERNWGFCLAYDEFLNLDKKAKYEVYIDSDLNPKGRMVYGELVISGESKEELFFSSYICHPQMCNNELSGPCLLIELVKYILSLKKRRYTYRFILVPETIGAIMYLSQNIKELKDNVIGGYNLTCVGDERDYSFVPSRVGNNISDQVGKYVLDNYIGKYTEYSWLDRGSDTRQYCAPGVDLPVSEICRTKYNEYPEYHTSLDDFNIVTEKGLQDSFELYKKIIFIFENNYYPQANVYCEPQLSKRGLYPTISTRGLLSEVENMMNYISFCDGRHSILQISEKINVPFEKCVDMNTLLEARKVVSMEKKAHL